jgi:hypothetical protein
MNAVCVRRRVKPSRLRSWRTNRERSMRAATVDSSSGATTGFTR